MSAGRCNVSNQSLTFCRVLSALLAPIERGTLSYVIVGWSDDSVCKTPTLLVASTDSEMNAVISGEAVMQLRLVRDGFIRWMNLLTWSIQSSKLSFISSWSHSCSQRLDNLSGPWYVPGMCTRVKWNMRIDTIIDLCWWKMLYRGLIAFPWYILRLLQLLDCRCQSNIFWMPLVFNKIHKVLISVERNGSLFRSM